MVKKHKISKLTRGRPKMTSHIFLTIFVTPLPNSKAK